MDSLLDEKEIKRRVAAIIAMGAEERPISINRLAEISGLHVRHIWDIPHQKNLQEKTIVRLSKALLLLENGQVKISRKGVMITDTPKPPQVHATQVIFTTDGPKIRRIFVNPMTFPDFKPKD